MRGCTKRPKHALGIFDSYMIADFRSSMKVAGIATSLTDVSIWYQSVNPEKASLEPLLGNLLQGPNPRAAKAAGLRWL